MNTFRKLNGFIHLLISGAILIIAIPACKKSSSGGVTPIASKNIIDKVNADPELTNLKSIIAKGVLTSKLSETGPFTLLAPVDAVLTAYDITTTSTNYPLSAKDCEGIVAYHTLAGKYLSSDFPIGENTKYFTIATPNTPKDSVFVTKTASGSIYVNGIDIDNAKKDITAANGVIHKLNGTYGFLFPPFANLYDQIMTNELTSSDDDQTTQDNGLDSLAKAITISIVEMPQLEEYLKNSILTLMTPTNKAFADYLSNAGKTQVSDISPTDLLTLLKNHLIFGRKFIVNIENASAGVPTYGGAPIKFDATNNIIYLNSAAPASVDVPDYMVYNGVFHKISAVLTK